jgi:hypothetical protein
MTQGHVIDAQHDSATFIPLGGVGTASFLLCVILDSSFGYYFCDMPPS